MKTKKTILFLVIILSATVIFSGCGQKRVKRPVQSQPATVQQQEKQTENKDEIDFSDPGDDQVGKEIQEIDSLINETSPSDYNEDDLSEEEFNE